MIETVIITKSDLEKIFDSIERLNHRIETLTAPTKLQFIDNEEFIKIMRISKRTAQTWRDEGKISFVQIGGKIYYKLKEMEDFFESHQHEAFNKTKGSSFLTRRINTISQSNLRARDKKIQL